MFSWTHFSKIAKSCAAPICITNNSLKSSPNTWLGWIINTEPVRNIQATWNLDSQQLLQRSANKLLKSSFQIIHQLLPLQTFNLIFSDDIFFSYQSCIFNHVTMVFAIISYNCHVSQRKVQSRPKLTTMVYYGKV